MIEMMARAITAVIADAHYNEEDFPDDAQRRQLRAEYIEKTWSFKLPQARAALSVLAANVSDEMVAKIICSAIWKTPAMVEKMWPVFLPAAREVIDTLTTPISAAGDEDRRAS